MAKFLFWVCAFLLAGAACTFGKFSPRYSRFNSKENNKKLITLIDRHIGAINDTVKRILPENFENIRKMKIEATNITHLSYENFFSIYKNVNSEIFKGLNESLYVNLTECAGLAATFYLDTYSGLEKMRPCLADTIKVYDDYIQNLTQNSNYLLKNLSSLKKDAEHCVINKHKWQRQAVKCINQSNSLMLRQVAPFHAATVKLQQQISDLIPKLATCLTVNGVEKILKNSTNIIEDIKSCIEIQKINAEV